MSCTSKLCLKRIGHCIPPLDKLLEKPATVYFQKDSSMVLFSGVIERAPYYEFRGELALFYFIAPTIIGTKVIYPIELRLKNTLDGKLLINKNEIPITISERPAFAIRNTDKEFLEYLGLLKKYKLDKEQGYIKI